MSTLSSTLVGTALANTVADRLLAGQKLAYSHPEYCGIGLAYEDGQFVCAEVYEGQLMSEGQYQRGLAQGDALEFQAFPSRALFVAWLAAQSDEQFSGRHLPNAWAHDNQRLTLQRLQGFAN
jgi:hypothetical protein